MIRRAERWTGEKNHKPVKPLHLLVIDVKNHKVVIDAFSEKLPGVLIEAVFSVLLGGIMSAFGAHFI